MRDVHFLLISLPRDLQRVIIGFNDIRNEEYPSSSIICTTTVFNNLAAKPRLTSLFDNKSISTSMEIGNSSHEFSIRGVSDHELLVIIFLTTLKGSKIHTSGGTTGLVHATLSRLRNGAPRSSELIYGNSRSPSLPPSLARALTDRISSFPRRRRCEDSEITTRTDADTD